MNDTLNGQIKSIKFKTSQQLNKSKKNNKVIYLDKNYQSYTDGATYTFNFNYDNNGNIIFEQDNEFNYDNSYNDKNQLIERITYKTSEKIPKIFIGKSTYVYENNKLKIKKLFNYDLGKECLYHEYIYNYDSNMNMTEQILNIYDCGILKGTNRQEHKYNVNNLKTETRVYSRFNSCINTIEYIYNKDNNLSKEVTRNGCNNEIESYKIIEYDKMVNTKIITSYIGKKKSKKEVFKYDKNMRLVDEKTFLNSNNKLFLHRLFLYQNDKLIEKTHDENETLFYKKVITYDTKGNITECTYYDKNNEPIRKSELQIEYY